MPAGARGGFGARRATKAIALGAVLATTLAPSSAASAPRHGGIAFSQSTGAWGISYNWRDMPSATQRALRGCSKHANDCEFLKGIGTSDRSSELCAALAAFTMQGTDANKEPITINWPEIATASTRTEAEEQAMSQCRGVQERMLKGAPVPADAPPCTIRAATCSRHP